MRHVRKQWDVKNREGFEVQFPFFCYIQPLLVFSSSQCLLWQSSLVSYGFNICPVGPVAWYLSWILFYVSHWNPYHTCSQSSTYLLLFPSKTLSRCSPTINCRDHPDTFKQLVPAVSRDIMPLQGLMFTATLFFVNANYQVSQQLQSALILCVL